MPKYLLDAGPLSAYLRGFGRATALINPWVSNKEVVTSDLVYAEVYEFIQDFFPNPQIQSRRLLNIVLGPIPSLSLDYPILHRYTNIRRYLRPINQLIGDIDTLIAATAIESGLSVVTNNEKHFKRVPGLNVIPY